jgi:C-terminal processing protease CtpA/Prc
MTNTPPPDRDNELAKLQASVIAELKARMEQIAEKRSEPFGELMTLGEISDSKGLRLDASDLAARRDLSDSGLQKIVDRATLLLSSFYVHLSGKRARYASDPLQALRILRADVDPDYSQLSEEQFHERLTAIFVGLHDRHTNYYLPEPYRRTLAFLPFLVEGAWDGTRERYLVTKIAVTSVVDGPFSVTGDEPVEVTHFNGVPIEQVVIRNGDESAGANHAARRARGVDRLTFRWLGLGPGPREEWVDVRFTVGDQVYERRFGWLAVRRPVPGVEPRRGSPSSGIGRDLEGEWIRDVKEMLFFQAPVLGRDPWERIENGVAAYRTYRRAPDDPEYGYLRIFTFEVSDGRILRFVRHVEKVLRAAPEDGLIIDIRGNPGGSVLAAEGLLQLFSSSPVARQGIQYVNTADAVKLAGALFKTVVNETPVGDARATSAPYVVFPEMPSRLQRVMPKKQAYQGQVVVIVDANCYSAAEMFAAGMQDHGLATIVGTDTQTGGGGGVVWSDERIAKECRDPELRKRLAPLPGGASFEVAVLRTTRTGEHAGVPVEDMGVVMLENDVHPLTRDDVLHGNQDLRTAAIEVLASDQRAMVRATLANGAFTLTTRGVDRVDVRVHGVPCVTVRVTGDRDERSVQLLDVARPPSGDVVFDGLLRNRIVTSFVWRKTSPPAPRPEAQP